MRLNMKFRTQQKPTDIELDRKKNQNWKTHTHKAKGVVQLEYVACSGRCPRCESGEIVTDVNGALFNGRLIVPGWQPNLIHFCETKLKSKRFGTFAVGCVRFEEFLVVFWVLLVGGVEGFRVRECGVGLWLLKVCWIGWVFCRWLLWIVSKAIEIKYLFSIQILILKLERISWLVLDLVENLVLVYEKLIFFLKKNHFVVWWNKNIINKNMKISKYRRTLTFEHLTFEQFAILNICECHSNPKRYKTFYQ